MVKHPMHFSNHFYAVPRKSICRTTVCDVEEDASKPPIFLNLTKLFVNVDKQYSICKFCTVSDRMLFLLNGASDELYAVKAEAMFMHINNNITGSGRKFIRCGKTLFLYHEKVQTKYKNMFAPFYDAVILLNNCRLEDRFLKHKMTI